MAVSWLDLRECDRKVEVAGVELDTILTEETVLERYRESTYGTSEGDSSGSRSDIDYESSAVPVEASNHICIWTAGEQ